MDTCRRRYREFVEKAIGEGTRPELTGGGMVRSVAGWQKIKSLRQSGGHLKRDERILGYSNFVEAVLEHQQGKLDRRYRLKAAGYDLDKLIERVCERFELAPADILEPGKQPKQVQAKSLLCYLAVRKLGLKGTEVGQRLRLPQSAVSRAIQRGKRIATELNFSL